MVSYFIVPLLITIAYLGSIFPIFLFTITIISLPIILTEIVQSRYYYFSAMTVLLLLFQLAIMILNSVFLSNQNYIYSFHDIVILMCISLIIIGIITPIYYLIKSFVIATIVSGLFYFTITFLSLILLVNVLGIGDMINFNKLDPGYVLIVEKFIPFQPYLILMIASVLFYYLSMKFSEWLFIKKDKTG